MINVVSFRNLPSKCGYKDIQCLLSACGIVSRKIKKLTEVAYVTFRNEEERERAVNLLDEKCFKGCTLKVSEFHLKLEPSASSTNLMVHPMRYLIHVFHA